MPARPVNRRLRPPCVRARGHGPPPIPLGPPRKRPSAITVALVALLLSTPLARAAGAQSAPDARPAHASRWLPTLTLGIGAIGDPENATAISDGNTSDPTFDPGAVSISGSDLNVAPQFIVLVGVESPEIVRNLRVFASGGILPTLGFEIDVAKEGDPRGFEYPDERAENKPYPEGSIDGTGIRSSAQLDPLAWAANIGVSYGFDVGDYRLDVRPSVGYFRYAVRAEGVRLVAVKPDIVDPFVREVSLDDARTQAFNALGPAIEIGVNLGKKGRFQPTVFIDGSFYRVLGDRVIEMTDATSDAFGTELGYWTVMENPWIYRLGAGLRIAWIGD